MPSSHEKPLPEKQLFVQPGCDLTDPVETRAFYDLSREQIRARWQDAQGREILKTWRDSGFQREALTSLIGKLQGQLDLRGIPLPGADLSVRDLTRMDFFYADLSNAKLQRSDLSHSYLSEADLRGTDLSWIKLDEYTLWDGVRISQGTAILGVQWGKGNWTFAGFVARRIEQTNLVEHLKRVRPHLAWFLRVTSAYGESLGRWLFCCLVILLGFSGAIFWGPFFTKSGAENYAPSFLEALYFSVITFTTVGFGDYTPLPGFGQIIVATEAIVGYVMFGVMLVILTRKVAF